MNIDNIKRQLLMVYPLFGNIIAGLDYVYDNSFNDLCPACTDGIKVIYTDRFFEYSDEDRLFILAHELLHVVFKHHFRNPNRNHFVLNYVADGIINQILVRDGFKLPEDAVNIPDALNYSVNELYIKYLNQSNEIEEYMKKHGFHIEIVDEDDNRDKGDSAGVESNDDLKHGKKSEKQTDPKDNDKTFDDIISELMKKNKHLKNKIGDSFDNNNERNSGKGTANAVEQLNGVGENENGLNWLDILKMNLKTSEEVKTLYHEIEPDGIIKRIFEETLGFTDTEIVIDSSSSVLTKELKVVLSECKNILKTGTLRIRFVDVKAYNWININTQEDIDRIHIFGRGGTDFKTMANSFTDNAENKIIITDGYDEFPAECDDILWIIFSTYNYFYAIPKHINYMIIDIDELRNNYGIKSRY